MKIKTIYVKLLVWLLFATSGSILVGLSGTYLYLSPKLPSVDSLRDVRLQTPLRIYTEDEKLIGEFGEQRRTPVKFEEIPKLYINALLAAEDSQFFEHSGVSIKGITRAVLELVATGEKGSGGSTLTMQVARNYFLTPTKAFIRKFNEILLAIKIEHELSKEEIFELYVNVTFLGKHAYGIASAAEVYYGKTLQELTLAQMAMIAGLPQGPSFQNPIINPTKAKSRRNWILGRMKLLEMINEEEYQRAIDEPVTATYHFAILDLDAPYIAELARQKAQDLLGAKAFTDGYKVYITADSTLQDAAQKAVIKGLIEYDNRHGYRGAEQRFNSDELEVVAGEDDGISVNYGRWLARLRELASIAELAPAVVTQVEEKRLHVLSQTGEILTLEWDQGLSGLRPYLSENSRGKTLDTLINTLFPGDVIRLKSKPGSTLKFLAQIPDAQAAHIALDPKNGAIRALVGGLDFKQSTFIRAVQAKRQPGSNFKPFVYAAALESGVSAASIVNDAPIVFNDKALENDWRPENDGGRFYGPTRIREALYRSRNLVSIRLLRDVGISKVISGMSRFGFDEQSLPRDLSLALGSHAITPLDLIKGWAVLANGGYQVDPYLIDKIVNVEGEVEYQATPATICINCEQEHRDLEGAPDTDAGKSNDGHATATQTTANETIKASGKDQNLPDNQIAHADSTQTQPKRLPLAKKVMDDRVVYIMDSMLKDVILRGTGTRAKSLGRNDLAGKTGTTNGPKDAWFSGYSSHLVATTWVGFDNNTPLGSNEYGGSAALPIWIDFMRDALAGKPEIPKPQPPGLVTIRIDPKTGKRANLNDTNAIFEIFRSENVPPISNQNDSKDSQLSTPFDEGVTEELF